MRLLCKLGLHRFKTVVINHRYHRKCKCGKEIYNVENKHEELITDIQGEEII